MCWVVQGWLSISLVTSSLLKAVGLSSSATGAAAAGAAIKWITKDGAGSIGRLVVSSAGRLSTYVLHELWAIPNVMDDCACNSYILLQDFGS